MIYVTDSSPDYYILIELQIFLQTLQITEKLVQNLSI